jgi:alkylation response protein AidB-like acyl-CoA dehydrogenase
MANLIIDPRDQKFVLYEMLNVEELCKAPLYADFSREMFDMALNEAERFATTVIFPTLAEGDKEGCRLEGGNVYIPKCYHRCAQIYREGGWSTMNVDAEDGGQGFPLVVSVAAKEWSATSP